MTINDTGKKIHAKISGNAFASFSELAIDTRALSFPSETLFIAIKTTRNDGHNFVNEAYSKGVRCFLVSNQKINTADFPDAGFLLVEDTIPTLQKIVSLKRKKFKKPVIAITGSNGKTVVKEWLSALLDNQEKICKNPKSYNSQIGVPLSVWKLEKHHSLGIFEAGISMPGEMIALEKIIAPDIGIITNIRSAHDENFISSAQKTKEKLQLFNHAKKIFFRSDYADINIALKNVAFKKTKKISWSISTKKKSSDTLWIKKTIRKDSQTQLLAEYKKKKISLSVPFCDDASIENISFCWLYLLDAGYNNNWIQEAVTSLNPVPLRLEIKQGIHQSTIINDSYSSDIESLSIALDLLNRQHQHPNKTVILSDISESALNTNQLYQKIASVLREKKIHRLIGIGKNICSQRHLFPVSSLFFASTEIFLEQAPLLDFSRQAILVKGARVFQFEKISEFLQEKSHDTILEINLNSILHNVNYFRSLLQPETKIMAMVKAFSYGSGSYEIASFLQHHRINYFAVAYADEGVQLRKNGITAPIMVMSPEMGAFSDLIHFGLEPEIFSLRILNAFLSFVSSVKNKRIPEIHLKIDTGMNRLGFTPEEIPVVVATLKKFPSIKVASIFSHLAASDNLSHHDFTLDQINLFAEASEKIIKQLGYRPILHICNTAAVSNFPKAQFDMVRLGIGMYGVGASEKEKNNLMNAGCWKTSISQLKHLSKNNSVGYNRSAVLKRDSVIATVPVGYADGFARKLSGGKGHMWLRGEKVPVIGNVCMDMCMLDITDVYRAFKTNPIREGEEVIIFDSNEKLNLLAKAAETIPYEILTAISPRVKRIYLSE
jgi:Alr-MurF fusion protein